MKLPEYQNFRVKESFYEYKMIKTKAQFDEAYKTLKSNNDHLIFRGLREARFKIFTSGQREWITKDLGAQIEYVDFIQRILENIKKNKILHDYYLALNVIPNDLLYLSFLQHYGSPTPMIDFTHDLNTALFFAYYNMEQNDTHEKIGDYVSLYWIDTKDFNTKGIFDMINLYNKLYKSDDFKEFSQKIKQIKQGSYNEDTTFIDFISELVKWGDKNVISAVNIGIYDGVFSKTIPSFCKTRHKSLVWANLNLIAQKGCFINYNRDDIPLEEYLKNNYLPKIHCIDIPKSFEKYVSERINKKHEDIFPQEEDIAQNSYHDYLKTF